MFFLFQFIPRIPILISCNPTLIPMIPTLTPRSTTLITRIPTPISIPAFTDSLILIIIQFSINWYNVRQLMVFYVNKFNY